jgi:hypothetical protein
MDKPCARPDEFNSRRKKMNDILAGFKVKKTFILSLVAVSSLFCEMNGWWIAPQEWYMMLGFGGMAAVRAGMTK